MKRLILNPITFAALLVMFLVSAPEMNFSKSGLGLVDNADAKDNDKGKDNDGTVYNYDQANGEDAKETTTYNCSNLENLQITYHEDFVATSAATGPNVLVTGSDSSTCTVEIIKLSGGSNCGHDIDFSDDSILVIKTNALNSATDCEMCIEATVPKATDIKG
ncbi:MAG: hypothetical protein ACI8PD_001671 [Nitrospinales bacterium]|jgi:hypothetical protein